MSGGCGPAISATAPRSPTAVAILPACPFTRPDSLGSPASRPSAVPIPKDAPARSAIQNGGLCVGTHIGSPSCVSPHCPISAGGAAVHSMSAPLKTAPRRSAPSNRQSRSWAWRGKPFKTPPRGLNTENTTSLQSTYEKSISCRTVLSWLPKVPHAPTWNFEPAMLLMSWRRKANPRISIPTKSIEVRPSRFSRRTAPAIR